MAIPLSVEKLDRTRLAETTAAAMSLVPRAFVELLDANQDEIGAAVDAGLLTRPRASDATGVPALSGGLHAGLPRELGDWA